MEENKKITTDTEKSFRLFETLEEDLTDGIFEFWKIDNYGNIIYIPDEQIFITSDKLVSENYVNHYLTKADLHKGGISALKEFYSAYMYALRVAGFKSITIDVEKPHRIISTKKH